MRKICLGAIVLLTLMPAAAAAEAPTLYAVSQNSAFDELLTYDLKQDPLTGLGGYQPTLIAPLDTSLLGPNLKGIAVSGSTLYAVSENSAFAELLTYDLKENPLTGLGGYHTTLIAPLDTSILGPTIKSFAVSGSKLYALSENSAFAELLVYDLTQDPLTGLGGYQPTLIAPLDTSVLGPNLKSIAVAGNTLYALSENSAFAELLTYDLTQDPLTGLGGYQPTLIAPLDTSVLGPNLKSIAVSGDTLYAMSENLAFAELLTYDLTQDPLTGLGGYQPTLIAPLDTSILGPTLISIAVDTAASGAPSSSVPEPTGWGMMLAGFGMAGGAMRYRRRRTIASFA